jgi:hypothetical protein
MADQRAIASQMVSHDIAPAIKTPRLSAAQQFSMTSLMSASLFET